jgi:hypothetical protein
MGRPQSCARPYIGIFQNIDCEVSDGGMRDECEGTCHDQAFAWKAGKPRETPVRIIGVPTAIETPHLPNC